MSKPVHETPGGESLTTESFLETFESTNGQCFHLVGGVLGGRGETEPVVIADYPAPLVDIMQHQGHMAHWRASETARTVEIPLSIPSDFRYAFEPEMLHYRFGKAELVVQDRRIPVRLLTLGDKVMSDSWIFRDESDQPEEPKAA